MRSWRNWQTRQVEGLVPAMACWFKSSRPHSNEIRGSIPTKNRFRAFFHARMRLRLSSRARSHLLRALISCAVCFCPFFFCRLCLSSIPGPSAAMPAQRRPLNRARSTAPAQPRGSLCSTVWLTQRPVASRLPVVDAMNLMLARDVHKVLPPSPSWIDLRIERLFVGVIRKRESPAAGIANFALADERESAFLSHPIYGHHVHVVFQSSSIGDDVGCQAGCRWPIGRQYKQVSTAQHQHASRFWKGAVVADVHSDSQIEPRQIENT